MKTAASLLSALLAVFTPVAHSAAQSAEPDRHAAKHDYAGHIASAAHRFDMPAAWIRAVMRAESAGDARAVSEDGAMGLMQIMPGTWGDLRAQLGLGEDPFDPHDNILAGASYLHALYDRFGSPGFLAAYNAGPVRYAEHLATGRPLPQETRDFVAALAPLISASPAAPLQTRRNDVVVDWRAAPLFIAQLEDAADESRAAVPAAASAQGEPAGDNATPYAPTASDALFTRSLRQETP